MILSQYSNGVIFPLSLGYLLQFKFSKKLSSNYVSLTHASGAIILAALYKLYKKEQIYRSLKLWSSGYFIADSLTMITSGKMNIMTMAYLYHHFAATYILHQNPTIYMAPDWMLWGELSNIPTYFVYHYLHRKVPAHKQLLMWKQIQKIVYTGIRVGLVSKLAVKALRKPKNKKPVLVILPIYLMGLIWTAKILAPKVPPRIK